MPIYEYKCLECGNHLEAMQKISDEPLKECPKCSGKLEKQWSRTGFQFKGSGWYVTDYAGKGAGENKSETEAPATSDSTKTSPAGESTAKGDSASKSETKTTTPDKSSA
jgi:putative FmdB family regulatory protein